MGTHTDIFAVKKKRKKKETVLNWKKHTFF